MRSYLFLKIAVITFLLLYSPAINSQPRTVEFNKSVHDFGDIMLNSGHHKYTFTFRNISKQPIVIQTVISSCGCTTPVWTKSPVLPGNSGKLEVTFLNDQGPYPFDKSLTVYITGEPRPIILRIKGVVHEKPKSLKELFPEDFGGVSFRSSLTDIGNIAQGDIKTEIIEVANTSGRAIDVSFISRSKGLNFEVTPSRIPANSKAELKITVNTNAERNWGATVYSAIVSVNGREIPGREIRVTANIRDNFSSLTKEETDNAPLPMANSSSFDFGRAVQGSVIKTSFRIRNLGRRDLLIYKIDTGDESIIATHPSSIAPGATGVIDVKIELSGSPGEKGHILSLITNSPTRPVINLIITGNIIKK
jgi:hypothetical protein